MPSRRTACKWILSSLAGAAGATAFGSAIGAASDAYPDRPIRIVVPYTPGRL